MITLVQAWAAARRRLESAGVHSPAIDARLLLEAASGAGRADILSDPHRPLRLEQNARFNELLARRQAREPISHILGERGFWNIVLKVTPDVLTPRPDTETLLDVVLPVFARTAPFHLLDLGVGSGAILFAILAERPAATGVGIDVSAPALAVARENATRLGLADRVTLIEGNWADGVADAAFDLVVANPPYIATDVLPTLEPEVRDHEPRLALDGGADGLAAYRSLAPESLRVLRPGGHFAFEIGADQGRGVEDLFVAAGAVDLRIVQDLGGRDRVVVGAKKGLGKTAANS